MFIDKAKIYIQAGKGGDGHVSFRHEKSVEFGGPDGGNGGKGGSVFFVARHGPNTLSAYRHAIKVKAPDGQDGGIKNLYGRYGSDIYLEVPPGTVITDLEGHTLADLAKEGDLYLAAKGGRGGKGNRCFATSVRRTPRIAENGEPGEKKAFYLELKLLADAGLVGLPSAGKSTILSKVSNAQPKIADYPFTTLEPMLGTIGLSEHESFVLADLPGLIKGASLGKGLGFVFLRHIERCRCLIHVIDISREEEDAFTSFETINNELSSYKLDLLKRPMVIALNKMDCDGAKEKAEEFKKKLTAKYGDRYQVFEISALNGEGLKPLMRATYQMVQSVKPFLLYEPGENGEKVYTPSEGGKKPFNVVLDQDGSFRIQGEEVIKNFEKINHDTDEGMMKLLSYLNSLGVNDELHRLGAKNGDEVMIEDFTFEYYE
ncbi:MAG: GTPase ObgE [Bacilli bacterium]|jgi:GTP-binding protein|nr:GTPase ObgE [Bacilli bacterium]